MDLDILRSIARLLDEYLNYSGISFIQIYEEFSNQILRELDYNFEARNCDKFREIHKNDYKIYIPEINWELTSQKVLTMEWIDGIKINEIEHFLYQIELRVFGICVPNIHFHVNEVFYFQC